MSPTRLPRAWLRSNLPPRYWHRYRPWKGMLLIFLGLVAGLATAIIGGESADGRLGAVFFAIAFAIALAWSTSYDHEAYMAAQAGCDRPDHAWIPADDISKRLQPAAKETCPRCGAWR